MLATAQAAAIAATKGHASGLEWLKFALAVAGIGIGLLFTFTQMLGVQAERLARVEVGQIAATDRLTNLEQMTGAQLRDIRDAITRLDAKIDRFTERAR